MGAWIEINIPLPFVEYQGVAPFMGAWIEINHPGMLNIPSLSHPLWVRGLKYATSQIYFFPAKSHPLWVRGLKCIGNRLSFTCP